MLDRDDALPLWAQLEAELRRRLSRGEFDDGFPTDLQLSSQYDVSRPTVRQAVSALVDDGLLSRRRGQGTRVSPLPVEQALPGTFSLAHAISATGRTETSKVLACGPAVPPVAVAVTLGIEPGHRAVRVDRVRYADGSPLAIDRSWLPASLTDVLERADLSSGSLYDVLGLVGIRPTGGHEQIEPVLPASADRRRLHLASNEPAFRVHRVLLAGDSAVEDRVSIIRADEYRLTRTWGRPPAGSRRDD